MVKFLKFSFDSRDYLIPCHKILTVRSNVASRVEIVLDAPLAHGATGANEVASINVAFNSLDITKTNTVVNEIIAAVGSALTESWHNPIVELPSLTYPISSVSFRQPTW